MPTIWHSGNGKTLEIEKDQWLPGIGHLGRGEWAEDRGFFRALKIFDDTTMDDVCHHTCVKPIKYIALRVNPNVNCDTSVQGHCTAWVVMVIMVTPLHRRQ